ncbi:hypothetical protein FRC12_002844 [Ceratobasidium sp. 428]|nr:hypothetical protein FRC12_002844 [Ceratobasidium sp. 428]
MSKYQAIDEDSICDDLLTIGFWVLKLGLLWNATVFVVTAVICMDIQPVLLVLAWLTSPDFTFPTLQQILRSILRLPKLYHTLSTVFSRNPSMFIQNASMVSDVSTVLANRGSHWSSDKDGTGPRFITFSNEWDKRDDPPFKWYDLQPCTRFKSIDHRKSRDSPFFHEFLIIKLEDGSYCRVERTGEGSRLDAISRSGSLAHDIIERVTRDGYERQLDESSDIISRIELPHEFDLLDVLAICYAIQQHKHSSRYTLQRYNCYFFCCTVLVILTRRLLGWERAFTKEHWDTAVNIALDELSNRSRASLSEDSQRYMLPRLCTMLSAPENPQPTRFLIDEMREALSGDSRGIQNGFDKLHEACADVLWDSRLENAVRIAPQDASDWAVLCAMDGAADGAICPLAILTALECDHDSSIWNEPTCALVFATFSRKLAEAALVHIGKARVEASKISKLLVDECVKSWTEYYLRCCRGIWKFLSGHFWESLVKVGDYPSGGDSDVKPYDSNDGGSTNTGLGVMLTLLYSSKLNQAKYFFKGIWYLLALDLQGVLLWALDMEGSPPRNDSRSAFRTIYLRIKSTYRTFFVKVEFIRTLLLLELLHDLLDSYGLKPWTLNEFSTATQDIKDIGTFSEDLAALACEDAVLQTMNAVQNTISLGPGEWGALLTLASVGSQRTNKTLETWWWSFCKPSLLWPILDLVRGQLQPNISAKSFNLLDRERGVWVPTAVVQFQRQIQSRIADHAIRVATTRLGAAEVVQQDIEDAMENVWTLLPKGHGPMIVDGCEARRAELSRTRDMAMLELRRQAGN